MLVAFVLFSLHLVFSTASLNAMHSKVLWNKHLKTLRNWPWSRVPPRVLNWFKHATKTKSFSLECQEPWNDSKVVTFLHHQETQRTRATTTVRGYRIIKEATDFLDFLFAGVWSACVMELTVSSSIEQHLCHRGTGGYNVSTYEVRTAH